MFKWKIIDKEHYDWITKELEKTDKRLHEVRADKKQMQDEIRAEIQKQYDNKIWKLENFKTVTKNIVNDKELTHFQKIVKIDEIL